MERKRIAIMASGSGTNAENLMQYFSQHRNACIALVLTNNAAAGVISRAQQCHVPCVVMSQQQVKNGADMLQLLGSYDIDWVVLAGYLKLMPPEVVEAYRHRMINIHPSLLPDFGGKGMYGNKVHEAVLQSGATQSGITIHYVNEHFDKGEIVFQKQIPVISGETPEQLAQRIHQLEYEYYPKVVEQLMQPVI
jgi:phosphoribosylglycinamide formyltransferase-1